MTKRHEAKSVSYARVQSITFVIMRGFWWDKEIAQNLQFNKSYYFSRVLWKKQVKIKFLTLTQKQKQE